MPLPLDRQTTQHLSEELELAMVAHLTWFRNVNRVLVCDGTPNTEDLATDAHLRTPFGQWYHGNQPHPLANHSGFEELNGLQQSVHGAAQVALSEVIAGRKPSIDHHDRFMDLALKLNNQLRHLQLELIGDLLATDSLTGCFTRRGMIGRLQAEQERARRIQRPCCICLMDFDHFKRINDSLGHPAGDAVLSQGMRFVASGLRKYDTVYRYGGEEFLLCLPGTPLSDAAQVIERIRAGLAELPISLSAKKRHHATASFGLAAIQMDKPVEDSITAADDALLRAKANGRNRVEVWDQ